MEDVIMAFILGREGAERQWEESVPCFKDDLFSHSALFLA